MAVCTNCGREIPCGCPNPGRAEVKLSLLFGLVCGRCDAYNDSARTQCISCAAPLTDGPAPLPAVETVVPAPVALPPPLPTAQEPVLLSEIAKRKTPLATELPPPLPPQPLSPTRPAPLALTEVVKKPSLVCPRCAVWRTPLSSGSAPTAASP